MTRQSLTSAASPRALDTCLQQQQGQDARDYWELLGRVSSLSHTGHVNAVRIFNLRHMS